MLMLNSKKLIRPILMQDLQCSVKNMSKYLLSSAMVVGLALSFHSHAAQTIEISAEQQKAMGIKNTTVEKVSNFPLMTITGELIYALDKHHQISAPLAGKIVALYHLHGAVQKDQILAEVESEQWVAMQADLLQSQTALQTALQELKRAKKLKAAGASSTKAFNQAQADVAKWQAMKTQQSFSLQRLGMTASQINQLLNQQTINTQPYKLKAPVNGELFNLEVSLNEEISQGQAIAFLGENDVLVLDVPVPVEMAMNLQEGDKVYIPSLEQTAAISHIHNQVNVATQTVDIHIRIANPNKSLKAGLRLGVQFMQLSTQELFKFPATAISQLDGESVVYQANGEQVQALQVKLLSVSNGQAVVSLIDAEQTNFQQVVSVGSAAIKAAFSSDEEAE